jgi:MFS family permease
MALLSDRNLLLLFVGQGVSRLGDGLYTAAVAWQAWALTHNPSAVALVTVAAYAPAFLATFVTASYADRYDRRRLMIGTDLARAAVVAAGVGMLMAGALNLTVLVLGTALLALIGAPFAPARNAIVPQLVPAEHLQQANGVLQVAFRAAFFVGPLLLTPLLAFGSFPLVMAVDGLTFLVSAASLSALRVRRPAPAGQRVRLGADLAAGLAALRAAPDVLVVIATFVLALAVASGFLAVGLVVLVGQGGEYGLMLGIAGLAEIAGALVLVRLPLPRLAVTAVLAWALLGAFRLPLGLVHAPAAIAVLLAVTGLASALTDIPLIAFVQQRIPEAHLAKALGLWEAGIAGALAVSPFLASSVIGHIGVDRAFMVSSAVLIALALAAAVALTAMSRARSRPTERVAVPSQP